LSVYEGFVERTRNLPGKVWISRYLHSQDAQRDLEVGREPGFVPLSAREQVFLGQIPLILSDVHIVKLGSIAGLYLDLFGHFPVGVDPVALESPEDAIEAALLYPEPVFQSLNHLPMGMRIFQVHVERGRINGADPFKSSLTAPEFHAALEVRVENPHVVLSPKALNRASFLPRLSSYRAERIRARRGRRVNVIGDLLA
jgi:hypothetical protein